MGMFDRDKDFAPDGILSEQFPAGSRIILWDCCIVREDFPTDIGEATMAHLKVSPIADPSKTYTVSALGAVAQKVKEGGHTDWDSPDDDLPAVCETRQVATKTEGFSDAFVLQFIGKYDPSEADVGSTLDETPTEAPA